MLSVFPEFLNYSLLGIFIIRVTIGVCIFILSINIFKKKQELIKILKKNKYFFPELFINTLSITGLISSLFMVAGILTQISTLVVIYTLLNLLFIDSKGEILKQSKMFYISFIVICLSFLFLGPGFFGVDLPL